MRWIAAVLWMGLPLAAQQGPIGIVSGTLLESGTGTRGQLTIRSVSSQVFCVQYDGRTYFERAHRSIAAEALKPGDRLEIVADRQPGSAVSYARTVQVLEDPPAPAQRGQANRSLRPRPSALADLDTIFPRGNLTFAGTVSHISPQLLVLRTRSNGEKSILLRDDTKYLDNGTPVAMGSLKPHTQVYIRAGRNLDDELEAYQVVWGKILEPDR